MRSENRVFNVRDVGDGMLASWYNLLESLAIVLLALVGLKCRMLILLRNASIGNYRYRSSVSIVSFGFVSRNVKLRFLNWLFGVLEITIIKVFFITMIFSTK